MFGTLARVLGFVSVRETAGIVEVTGVPAEVIARHIAKVYSTKRITTNMFIRIWRSGFTFPSFFVVEVHYMLKEARLDAKTWSMKHSLDRIIEGLEEKTWLKSTIGPVKSMVDLSLLKNLKWKAKPHQIEFLKTYGDMVPRYHLRGYYLGSAPGTGKGLTLDSRVKIPGGWIKMRDIKVGTIVTAWDGKPTKVVGVFPQGKKTCYRLTFVDGRTVTVDNTHLWKVFYKDRVRQWRLMDTDEIYRLKSMPSPRLYIPLCQSEEVAHVPVPMDPWILGYLLGNGGRTVSVRVTTRDTFVIDEFRRIMPSSVKIEYQRRYDYLITSSILGAKNHYLSILRDMGIRGKRSWEKFIPEIYFSGSHAQRRALLQGLMDSGGTAYRSGSASYSTTSPQLAKDVARLAWSLGAIARIKPMRKYYRYKGKKLLGRPVFNVYIRHPSPEDLFRLPRKKSRVKNDNQYASHLKLEIKSIVRVEDQETQCIAVDHPDKLFVVEDYIVTHNTFMDLALAATVIPRDIAEVKIIISPLNAIHTVWQETVVELFHKAPNYWMSSTPGPAPVDRKTEYFIFHYESLNRAVMLCRQLAARGIKFFVIIDESHNFNEITSNRTIELVSLLSKLQYKPFNVWASGSPFKAMGKEAIPFLRSNDPFFTPDVEARFKKIFGGDNLKAMDILGHRLGLITFKTSKDTVMNGEKPLIYRRMVKATDEEARPFLIETIREEMRDFITERVKYYQGQLDAYTKLFNDLVELHRKTLPNTRIAIDRYKRYVWVIDQLRRAQAHRKRPPVEYLQEAKAYETTYLIPSLPVDKRKQFRKCQSVVKSLKLKVRGEAMGKILIPRRAQCAAFLGQNCRLPDIIKESESKTLVFSSSVSVILNTATYLTEQGFLPEVVYQKTNKFLSEIIKRFRDDPNVNPVCATFQSLSTAVPMIMASTLVMLNLPFRQYIYDQTISRVYRLGQPYQVKIYEVLLDTGDQPNVSTRAMDIIAWCREQLDVLLGGEFSGPEDDDVIFEKILKTT